MGDLVWHLTEVHHFFLSVIRGADPDQGTYVKPDRPADSELVEAFRRGAAELADTLYRLDPATPAWSWSPQKDVAFIQRRMAQETAVHAWDGLAASGLDGPIERELAVDGIDEYLRFFHSQEAPETTVHLHTTDGPGEWLVSPGPDGMVVTREHAKGAVAVRATASDLLLLLWRRRDLGVAEVLGEQGAMEGFLRAARL